MSLHYLKQAGSAVFVDRYITKAHQLIKPWNGEEIEGIGLIGAPLSKSSISHSGASFAPASIRKAFSAFSTYAVEEDIDLKDEIIHDIGDIEMVVTDIVQSQKRIEETMLELFTKNPQFFPITLGGDHSVSASVIKAFAKTKGTIGVIQFDAHHDLRNLEDGGPTNGTPFRSLLEAGAIKGENLIQIGIRNFSNSRYYFEYAKEQHVTVYTMKNVRERNIVSILEESIDKLKKKVDAIYVSVDMDVLDQAFAPGCPAIGPGGMNSQDLFDAVSYLGKESLVKGLDIVEIDPTLDVRDMTSRVAVHVILNFLKGRNI